jgi:hypothetical protein
MSVIYPTRLVGQQIRLLELQPASDKEAIKIRLISSDILSVSYFEAVSYVWGDQSVKKHISCQGADITVTENLYDALLHMRLLQLPRLIWADAICINQHDIVERKQQVSLMRRIFSQASRVVVWLGRDRGENLHLAVKAINLIYQRYLEYAESQNLSLTDCMSFKHFESIQIAKNSSLDNAFDNETWSSISHFFARQWFERIWCVQEIILAQQGILLLDICQIPWECVGTAAAILTAQISNPAHFGSGRQQRDKARQCISAAQLYLHNGKETILGNLETFCIRKATDPRDFVYGLVGLQDNDLAGGILEPDYSKKATEIYIDVVVATVNDISGLRILSNVQHEDSFQHKDDLPSWAPYWPRRRFVSFLARGKWYAGGKQSIEILFPSRRELMARGIILEEIVFVSDIHPKSPEEYGPLHPFLDLMLVLWRECSLWEVSNDSSQSGIGKLSRTLTAGCTANGEVVHQLDAEQRLMFYADYLAFIDLILQYKGQRSRTYTPVDLAAFNGNWQRYARGVQYACRYRRIFRTQKGSLGLGPACTRIGDRICVLKGGEVPYILRPAGESFYFLGECYIDDIMRGELFRGSGIDRPELKMLSLK